MAYSFNGTSQRLSLGTAVVSSAPYTLFAASRKTASTGVAQMIVSLIQAATNTPARSALLLDIVGGLEYGSALSGPLSGPGQVAISTSEAAANVWQQICGVFASDSSRTITVNAGGSASNTNSVSIAGVNRTEIGGRTNNGVEQLFYFGQLAEIAIWNVALTDQEINSLAKGFKPSRIRPQSLVFYAPLLRNVQDIRAGLALTNNNGATVANHPRVY